jgi:hypothetical protein
MKTPVALALLAIVSAACASKQPTVVPQATPAQAINVIPDWVKTPPTDQNYFYAIGTGESRDMQIANDEAELVARNSLGQQMAVKIEGFGKRMAQEVGPAADATILRQLEFTQKNVVSTELSGSRTAKREITSNGPTYRVFVLMELPVGKANEALLSKLKSDRDMYTRFRATKAFEDLDDEVKKYEEWKKKPPL